MEKDFEVKKMVQQFEAQNKTLEEIHAIGSGSAYGRILFWLEQGVPTKDLISVIRQSLDSNPNLKSHAEEMFRDLMARELENKHKIERAKAKTKHTKEVL